MKCNKTIQEQIYSFDKLKIEEAKKLYLKAISSPDEQTKRVYLDKLILGTLYVVYNYIDRTNLKMLEGSQYDLEDIQSAFTEIWIKRIENGDLLNVERYSLLFTISFFNDVYKNLVGSEIYVSDQFGYTNDQLIELFYTYVQLKNTGKSFTYKDLIETIREKNRNFYVGDTYRTYGDSILLLLEGMYNALNIDKVEDIDLNVTKIYDYIKLLTSNGLFDKISNDIKAEDMHEKVLNDAIYENFVNDIDESLPNERRRIVIHERFGLDGELPKTLDDIAKELGITSERVRQIEAKSLIQLKMTNRVRKYVK